MSTRSKVTFGITIALAVTVIPWVHYFQQEQRDALREGPLRDAARRQKKASSASATGDNSTISLTAQQKERTLEYEEQKRLFEEYSKEQKVKGAP